MTRWITVVALLLVSGAVLNAEVKKSFYADGTVKFERRYNNAGALHGYSKGYYPSGRLKVVSRFYNGVQDGTTVGYYENGNIKAVMPFDNGKLSGKVEEFYSNGARRSTEYYEDDVAVRTKTVYYPDGTLKAKLHFDDDGRLDGTAKEYYPNGTLQYNMTLRGGKAVKGYLYDRRGNRTRMNAVDFNQMGIEKL